MSVERSSEPLRIGEWRIEPALDQLSRDGECIKLEPRTMRLLMRLAAAPGEVVSSQQLLDDVWSGVVVGPASLYQAISQLRKLLADTDPNPAYIATVPRKGYRLIAPVRHIARAAPDGEDPDARPQRTSIMQIHRWLAAIVLISISATAFSLWLQGPQDRDEEAGATCELARSRQLASQWLFETRSQPARGRGQR